METEVTRDLNTKRVTVTCHTCGTSVEVSDTPFGHAMAQNFPRNHACKGSAQ